MKFLTTSFLALLLASSVATAEDASNIDTGVVGAGPLVSTRDQKTVVCPGENTQNLHEGHVQYGLRTRLLLKNTASDPVVVAFVNDNGSEVSAANAKIAPAQLDPDTVLAPGETKLFGVQEGHVFHIRDAMTGELLMQHRAGFVPIENRYDQEIDCPSEATDEYAIPVASVDYRVLRKFQQWKPVPVEKFGQPIELPVGFHNTIVSSKDGTTPCPVNLYFVKKQDQNPHRKPNYVEKFSTHLGVNQWSTAEEEAPNSSIKYETTYSGHQFAVRLAHDDSVVVDYITMGPMHVHDCSNKKKTDATVQSAAHASAMIIPVGTTSHTHASTIMEGNSLVEVPMNNNNRNNTNRYFDEFVNRYNTTEESRRGLYFQIRNTE